jgi:hypothetical protein
MVLRCIAGRSRRTIRYTRPYTTGPVPSFGDDFIHEIVLKSERNEVGDASHREQMKSAINLNCTTQVSLGGDARM